jgi:hypothetical protein
MERSGGEAGDEVYSFHRVTADWGEGESDSGDPGGMGTPAVAGEVTWLSRFHGVALWSTPGGEFLAADSASLEISRISPNPEENIYEFAGDPLADDVRLWVTNPNSNFGWILIGEEDGSRNARRFHSSESPRTESRPLLTVTITPPGTDGVILR